MRTQNSHTRWRSRRIPGAVLVILLLAMALPLLADLREFRDLQGRRIEAEILEVEEETVRLQRKDRNIFEVEIDTLSESDAAYVRKWGAKNAALIPPPLNGGREEREEGSELLPGTNFRIVAFIREKMGRKVGDGQCWALANEAFKAVGAKRPGTGQRVWGRVVDPEKEEIFPGDIIEIERGPEARWPHHTAVFYEWIDDDQFVVAEQNWNRRLYITTRKFRVSKALQSTKEKYIFYRPPAD